MARVALGTYREEVLGSRAELPERPTTGVIQLRFDVICTARSCG
jgi:hypothetical protein